MVKPWQVSHRWDFARIWTVSCRSVPCCFGPPVAYLQLPVSWTPPVGQRAGLSITGGTPKWMVHKGKSHKNGWSTPILGPPQIETSQNNTTALPGTVTVHSTQLFLPVSERVSRHFYVWCCTGIFPGSPTLDMQCDCVIWAWGFHLRVGRCCSHLCVPTVVTNSSSTVYNYTCSLGFVCSWGWPLKCRGSNSGW